MSSLGKGTAAIFAAKITFIFAGYALYMGLGRLLTTEEFGVYGVVFGVVSVINMVCITGTLQTISRFTAAHAGSEEWVRRRGFKLQAMFAGSFLGMFALGAPVVAAFLNDASLTLYFRTAPLITLMYAFYAVNVGYLNGRRLFIKQASLDIGYAFLRVGLMLLLAFLGFGVGGTIVGFAIAATLIFAISFLVAGLPRGGKPANLGVGDYFRFGSSVMGVALVMNLVMNTDLLLLKKLTGVLEANTHAGWYTAAQSVARIPYYIMASASLVAFPLVAALRGEDSETRTQRADMSSRAMSAVFTLVAGMAAVTVPLAGPILSVLYPDEFLPAAPTLSWLIPGLCLLTLVNLASNIISGAGHPVASLLLLAACLVAQAGGLALLVPVAGPQGAAVSTTIAAALGLAASLAWMHWKFGTRMRLQVIFVTCVACAAVAGLSHAVHLAAPGIGRIATVIYLAVAYGLYLTLVAVGGVIVGLGTAPRRVLLVSKPLDPPMNDGAKVLVRSLVENLDPHELTICRSKRRTSADAAGEPDWPDGLAQAAIYSSAGSFQGRLMQNARMFGFLLVFRYQYRCIHFFFAPNRAACVPLKVLRWLTPGVRFIQTILSQPAADQRLRGLVFGDIVTVGSEHAAERVAKDVRGIEPRLIRPGVSCGDRGGSRSSAVASLGLPEGRTYVLFAGDIEHGGALEHLSPVMAKIQREDEQVHLLFSIRVKSDEARRVGEQFFAEHFDAQRASSFVDHQPFDELLDAADAMIFPAENTYRKIDAPLVVLETLARGKPVFLLDRPPAAEVVPAALRDQLVASSAEKLAELVLRWLADRDRVPAEVLRSWVADRFDADRMASEYHELWQSR